MPLLKPAIKNGVGVALTRPDSPPILRPFDGPLPVGRTVDGFSLVTVVSTLGGHLFTVSNAPLATTSILKVDGQSVVQLGAQVVCDDGYQGVVGPEHCPGLSRLVS